MTTKTMPMSHPGDKLHAWSHMQHGTWFLYCNCCNCKVVFNPIAAARAPSLCAASHCLHATAAATCGCCSGENAGRKGMAATAVADLSHFIPHSANFCFETVLGFLKSEIKRFSGWATGCTSPSPAPTGSTRQDTSRSWCARGLHACVLRSMGQL